MATYTISNQTQDAPPLPPGLYVVATPIGNLGDITLRGLEVLAAADVVACEDTRTSGVLLQRYGITTTKVSYTEHNADARGPGLLRQIGEGKAVALISDAGTPLVSDPGSRLVAEAVAAGVTVTPLPGAAAPIAALVGSGLADGDFKFCGFLPPKAKARIERFSALAADSETLIFFESPNRILATLEAMRDTFGERPICVARELTKLHETFHRGSATEVHAELSAMDRIRGEIVIIVSGAQDVVMDDAAVDAALVDALQTLGTKQAAAQVASISGRAKAMLYARALELKQ
jgi:16S rRNA (cytidine1402-2'-O)-methyltransferase